MKLKPIPFLSLILTIALIPIAAFAADPAPSAKPIRKLIFEEQKIEGKIRRPQLVLIKADQRPQFAPMIIQSLGKNTNIVDFVDQSVIEKSPYSHAFQFDGSRISNYVP